MDNAILIWKYLLPQLQSNQELVKYINPDNMFPLVAKSDTPYPFLIFKREGISTNYTKATNGGWVNTVTISVTIYSDNYTTGAYLINQVRDSLENYTLENDEIKIYPIEMVACTESFTSDMFMQQITFNVTTV